MNQRNIMCADNSLKGAGITQDMQRVAAAGTGEGEMRAPRMAQAAFQPPAGTDNQRLPAGKGNGFGHFYRAAFHTALIKCRENLHNNGRGRGLGHARPLPCFAPARLPCA